MMKVRRFSVLLLALALAVLASSCGGRTASSDSGQDGITLTLAGKKSDLAKTYLANVLQQYEQATGNRVQLVSYEDAAFETEASEDFAKGDVPDLFLHFHTSDLARFDVENIAYYLNDESWVPDLTESALHYCQDDEGHLLGLPFWESSVSGCYYNKTILDSLGLKPATTQLEFDTLCQALADAGYTPICWPENGCGWMIQFGMDPIFADDPELLERINNNAVTYAEIPAMRDLIQWISDAADKDWFGDKFTQTGWDDISPSLASGEAVMTFIWDTWFYTDFHPDKYTLDDFALMPVFMNTADSGTYEGGNLNMMMVNKNGEHLQQALELLEFCATPEHYNAAFDGISTVNCFKGQNTNIQSFMVTDMRDSIAANERVSTAASRIVGYSSGDMISALDAMFTLRTDVDGCLELMDEYRIAGAGWLSEDAGAG